MVKIFKLTVLHDNSWTGGDVYTNLFYLKDAEDMVNNYLNEANLKLTSVTYQYTERRIQHGSSSFNIEIVRDLFITVSTRKKILGIF